VIFCLICEDTTFHFTHRLLHWRKIYPYIHKIHHKHITTVSIASENAHPIEYLLGNGAPMLIGPWILG
jgi:sterol desaturase/sphingolipid hydroxylase (fatty acid hydroxylase superfamily)